MKKEAPPEDGWTLRLNNVLFDLNVFSLVSKLLLPSKILKEHLLRIDWHGFSVIFTPATRRRQNPPKVATAELFIHHRKRRVAKLGEIFKLLYGCMEVKEKPCRPVALIKGKEVKCALGFARRKPFDMPRNSEALYFKREFVIGRDRLTAEEIERLERGLSIVVEGVEIAPGAHFKLSAKPDEFILTSTLLTV